MGAVLKAGGLPAVGRISRRMLTPVLLQSSARDRRVRGRHVAGLRIWRVCLVVLRSALVVVQVSGRCATALKPPVISSGDLTGRVDPRHRQSDI